MMDVALKILASSILLTSIALSVLAVYGQLGAFVAVLWAFAAGYSGYRSVCCFLAGAAHNL
jgi:hypothetical protein